MKGVIYIEDIIKELSLELNIPEAELDEICRKSLMHINDLTFEPNVISISIPNLGTLHFNAGRAKGSYKGNPAYKRFEEIIESQINLVSEKYKINKDSVHSRRSYYSNIKKFFFPDRKLRFKISREEVYKKLEQKQNKIK